MSVAALCTVFLWRAIACIREPRGSNPSLTLWYTDNLSSDILQSTCNSIVELKHCSVLSDIRKLNWAKLLTRHLIDCYISFKLYNYCHWNYIGRLVYSFWRIHAKKHWNPMSFSVPNETLNVVTLKNKNHMKYRNLALLFLGRICRTWHRILKV